MLVIISDLHLTDGTSGSTISPGAFLLLGDRLVDLARGASQRRDGGYRPIERVDLVLLGDVLDVIRSTRWLDVATRPWDDAASSGLSRVVGQITADVLRHNAETCGEFRRLAEQGLRIPAATRDGRPAERELHAVPVRIHYMVGNHDWFFHLPGSAYNALRRSVAAAMGLATHAEAPFPHEAWEDNELLQTMRRHKVFARHGDVFDPFNFEGDRNASSLGDAVVVELVNRFGVQVERDLGDDLPAAALAGLREIDNIRPLLMIPAWIEGLLERSCPQPAVRKQVKRVWDALADDFLDLPFVRRRDTWNPVDVVDGLQKALKFTRRLSVGWAAWIAEWMYQLRGASSSSYVQHALTEQDFRNRRARHIVYGHTHAPEVVPLDASYAEGYVLHQAYFNSGTWRRVYEQTRFAAAEHEFIAADKLTYLAFFKDDERRGRPYETWSGTLGLAPHGSMWRRLDMRGVSDAPGEPISTPSVPLRAPHFAVPLAPLGAPVRARVS
jgi:UDP-2,3-diacylglucosamine pyrophosphatase LpxH